MPTLVIVESPTKARTIRGFLPRGFEVKASMLRILHTSGYPRGAIAHRGEPRLAEGPIVGKPYRREELQKAIAAALSSEG